MHAQVVKGLCGGRHVACGGNGAAVVIERPGVDLEVRATAQERSRCASGNVQAIGFIDLPQAVSPPFTTKVTTGTRYQVAIELSDGHRAFFLGRVFQHIPHVIHGHGADAQVLRAFHRAGAVVQQIGLVVICIFGDQHIAQAIDRRIGIGEGGGQQLHVTAAENQTIAIECCVGSEHQVRASPQCAGVGHFIGNEVEVGRRRHPPGVVQLPCHCDPGAVTTGQGGGFAEVQLRGAQIQGSEAAQPTTGRISTLQVDTQSAVTGEQTVVGPVPACANKTVGCQ